MGALQKVSAPAENPQAIALPSSPALLHRNVDVWMIGGASLLFFFGYHFFTDASASIYKISWIMYYASLVVNWPHFMMSYQLLYWDRRHDLIKKPSYAWAAFAVPVILLGILIYGFQQDHAIVFSLLIQTMFLTVGWHYVKQIFGTMVVSSSIKGFYFTSFERKVLLTNLYSLWALNFVWGQGEERTADFYGVAYDLIGFGTPVFAVLYTVVGVTLAIALLTFLRRFLKEGKSPSTLAWVSFFSLYAWYIPFANHPHFFYVVPFFHSLQYILFVGALKKAQWSQQLAQEEPEARRRGYLRNLIAFGTPAVVMGALMFWGIPSLLDSKMPEWNESAAQMWGPTVFMAAFQVFINIHHYFVDNVIWKKDNPDLKQYLFRRWH